MLELKSILQKIMVIRSASTEWVNGKPILVIPPMEVSVIACPMGEVDT